MFMQVGLPSKDTVSVQKATLLDFSSIRFWTFCLCSPNTSEDALDRASWTLVLAKEVFDNNEASGTASVAMLSAAQE